MLPPGFQEIVRSLTAGKSSEMEDHSPLTRALQELAAESAVTTVIYHHVPGSDNRCHLLVHGNHLHGTYELGGSLSGSWQPGADPRGIH